MTIDPLRQLCLERGFFLRREARHDGVDDAALRRGVRSGQLVRIRHGAYTFHDLWDTATPRERHAALAGAVLLVHLERVALTHHSAVALHGIESWRLPLDKVHVTRLDDNAGRTAGDVVHHVGRLGPDDVVSVGVCPQYAARGRRWSQRRFWTPSEGWCCSTPGSGSSCSPPRTSSPRRRA